MNLIKLQSLAVMLLATNLCIAQEKKEENNETDSKEAKSKVILGFKAGINRSNVFDESGGNFVADPKPGYIAGVFLAVPFGSLLGFQPEIHISQKGFQGSGVIKDETYLIQRTTTHLDVPLQLAVKPFKFLTFLGGVNYSYTIKQKDKFTFGPSRSTEQNQEFQNDNIRKNIFGALIGLDINIQHFVLSGRSGWDMISNHGDGSSSTPRYKNMWLQGTIGYRIY